MRETKSARLTRMHDEYDILRQVIPAPACALHFSNPLELLIATVLSAQHTDKRDNTDWPRHWTNDSAAWCRARWMN